MSSVDITADHPLLCFRSESDIDPDLEHEDDFVVVNMASDHDHGGLDISRLQDKLYVLQNELYHYRVVRLFGSALNSLQDNDRLSHYQSHDHLLIKSHEQRKLLTETRAMLENVEGRLTVQLNFSKKYFKHSS